MAIQSTTVGNTDTTLLTVPAGVRYAITTILVCNTFDPDDPTASSNTSIFDMHLVPATFPKSDTNMVVRSMPVPAGETFTFDSEKIVLEPGDRVILLGQAPTNLSATISYLEV